MWRAVDLLRGLPRAPAWRSAGTPTGVLHRYGRPGHRRAGRRRPRRDGAVAAAARLARLERAQAGYDAQRAYDDPLVMAEYRLAGEAFAGTVVGRRPGRTPRARAGPRKLRPLVVVRPTTRYGSRSGTTVRTPGPAAASGAAAGCRGSADGVVTSRSPRAWAGAGRPPPGSVPEVGERVCYTSLDRRLPALGGRCPTREADAVDARRPAAGVRAQRRGRARRNGRDRASRPAAAGRQRGPGRPAAATAAWWSTRRPGAGKSTLVVRAAAHWPRPASR